MVKKYFLLFWTSTILLLASTYPSFHQHPDEYGKKGLIYQLTNSDNWSLQNTNRYTDTVNYQLIGNATCKENGGCKGKNLSATKWCSSGWTRFKVYIPKNVENVTLALKSSPDSIYVLIATFNPASIIDATNFKSFDDFFPSLYTNIDKAEKAFRKYMLQNGHSVVIPVRNNGQIYFDSDDLANISGSGGWLYIQMTQASNLMDGHSGFHFNPKIIIEYAITFKDDNKRSFHQWLQSTYFDPQTGDPVDGFDSVIDKHKSCIAEESVTNGVSRGVRGDKLLQGQTSIDPNIPSVSLGFSKDSVQKGDNVDVSVGFVNGEQTIDGIDVNINGNITTGILLENGLDDCLVYQQTKTDYKDGYFIYSDNGDDWYQEDAKGILNGNIKYVGYLIPHSISPKEEGQISFSVKVSDGCSKSIIQTAAILHYRNNDDIEKKEEIKKSLSLSTSDNIGNDTGGSTSGGDQNSGDLGDYYYTSSSHNSSTQMDSDTAARKQRCLQNHGTWSDEDNICLDAGGDEVAHSSYSSSSSSSSNVPNELKEILPVIKKIEKKTYPVKGYFAQYGEGAFDWIYYTSNGRLYKLKGMNKKNGYLQWEEITPYFSGVHFEEGKLIVGPRSIARTIDTRTNNIVRAIENKPFQVRGYFTNYNNGAFDWILETGNGALYKLNGMDDHGYFQWKPLSNYFTNISLKDYREVVIGEAKIISSSSSSSQHTNTSKDDYIAKAKANCQKVHGQWIEEDLICIAPSSTSNSSSSSMSSSSSLNSSNSSSTETHASSNGIFPG